LEEIPQEISLHHVVKTYHIRTVHPISTKAAQVMAKKDIIEVLKLPPLI